MRLFKSQEMKIADTLSLMYVGDLDNSLCLEDMKCIWKGSITPAVRVCLRSSCGCSDDFCESVSKVLEGGHVDEWRIQVLNLELVLLDVQADGTSLSFDFAIE
jgi:hypothetical protein